MGKCPRTMVTMSVAEPTSREEASELKVYLDSLPVGERLWAVEFFHHLFEASSNEAEATLDAAYADFSAEQLAVPFDELREELRDHRYLCGLFPALDGPGPALDNYLDAVSADPPEWGMVAMLRRLADDMVVYRDLADLPEAQLIARYKALLRRLLCLLNDESPVSGLYSLSKLALERFDVQFARWCRVNPAELRRDKAATLEFKETVSQELAEESLFNPYRSARTRALMVLERLSSEVCEDPLGFLARTFQRIGRTCRRRQRAVFAKRVQEIQEALPSLEIELPPETEN